MTRTQRIQQKFLSLSRIEQAFLISLFLRIAYALIGRAAGLELPGSGLVRFLFIVASILFLVRSFPKWARVLLWRVRHRLLVTWIFVGVVPIVLICLLVGQGLFFFMGQVVGYMTTNEIRRQSELVRSTAQGLAWNLSHRTPTQALPMLIETFVKETSAARNVEIGAIVHAGEDVFVVPADGAINEIPKWSKADFLGLVKDKERYYFGSHVVFGASTGKAELFLYQHAPAEFFQELLPNIATVQMGQGSARAGAIEIEATEKRQSGVTARSSRRRNVTNPDPAATPLPPARGWWDFPVNWIVLMPTIDKTNGETDDSLAIVASRTSLVIMSLFSNLGNLAPVIFIVMAATAGALLIVEIVSVLFGVKLTRSITRSVADLYEGTRKVQTGNFSHRIPVRKTKDQLSELAGSFNDMTARVQNLILEVQEKERLENELAIARDVQSQLFPKDVPQLKTLELWGGCQPARMVSGDYYDFVSLGTSQAALAIGDISGKGISAALLMAHIQSALRSQFMNRNGGNSVASLTPAGILSLLNDHLYTSSAPEKYATFFLGLYTDDGAQLTYTNAGHLPPMLVRRGSVVRLAGDGFPVGLFPGIQYDQQSLGLEPGDLLVGFTDGVTEAPNLSHEEYGDQRLKELLIHYCEQPLDRIADKIITSIAAWAGDVERHDDTTLLLARRL